jgi:hypothetical protein
VDHAYGERRRLSGLAWEDYDDPHARIPQKVHLVRGGLELQPFDREVDGIGGNFLWRRRRLKTPMLLRLLERFPAPPDELVQAAP